MVNMLEIMVNMVEIMVKIVKICLKCSKHGKNLVGRQKWSSTATAGTGG